MPIVRYSDDTPLATTTGDLEALALYAGQSAGLLSEVKGAATIIEDLLKQAQAELTRIHAAFKQ